MTKKNDETIKNEKKNNEQANTVKNKKYNLVELVEQHPLSLPRLTMDLSRTGLLKQYEEEYIKIKEGIHVEPSLTMEEFIKIIDGGK
jgi:hypothetical protein